MTSLQINNRNQYDPTYYKKYLKYNKNVKSIFIFWFKLATLYFYPTDIWNIYNMMLNNDYYPFCNSKYLARSLKWRYCLSFYGVFMLKAAWLDARLPAFRLSRPSSRIFRHFLRLLGLIAIDNIPSLLVLWIEVGGWLQLSCSLALHTFLGNGGVQEGRISWQEGTHCHRLWLIFRLLMNQPENVRWVVWTSTSHSIGKASLLQHLIQLDQYKQLDKCPKQALWLQRHVNIPIL